MTKPGVPSSYDQITHGTVPEWRVFRPPQPPETPGERDLQARVADVLAAEPRLELAKIEVLVHGTRVWLTGHAIGPGTAAYAEDLARRVPGVTEVVNELVIGRV